MALRCRASLAPVALLALVAVAVLPGCQTAEKGFQETCAAAGHEIKSPAYNQCVHQQRRAFKKQTGQRFYRSGGGGASVNQYSKRDMGAKL